MKIITQEEADRRIGEHQRWLDGKRGKRLDFVKADLTGVSFKRGELEGAVFEQCDLSGVDFESSNLKRAYFERCQMEGANFKKSILNQAIFDSVNAQRANFEYAEMNSVDIEGLCLFKGAMLSDIQASGTNFGNAAGIPSIIDCMEQYEKSKYGYIGYIADMHCEAKTGEVWKRSVVYDRFGECGGINFYKNKPAALPNRMAKKALVRWGWACGICAPYNFDGSVYCERVEILGEVEE